jgi:hypothetical protein
LNASQLDTNEEEKVDNSSSLINHKTIENQLQYMYPE